MIGYDEPEVGSFLIRFELALVALTLAIMGAKAGPIVLIDHEWNVRFAKSACEKAEAECSGDPTLAVHMFEARISAAMAVSAKCEGIEVVKLTAGRKVNNPASEPVWFLKIDDWELGKVNQPWSLNLAGRTHLYEGRGDPETVASAVCGIVKAAKR
jgi:hypothetical protein